MKYFWIGVLSLVLVSTSIAQQPQQSPSAVALQITGIIGQWAQAIEALQKQNTDLQKELAAVTKERDELKAKEPKQ
jgi:hypothetical protein